MYGVTNSLLSATSRAEDPIIHYDCCTNNGSELELRKYFPHGPNTPTVQNGLGKHLPMSSKERLGYYEPLMKCVEGGISVDKFGLALPSKMNWDRFGRFCQCVPIEACGSCEGIKW